MRRSEPSRDHLWLRLQRHIRPQRLRPKPLLASIRRVSCHIPQAGGCTNFISWRNNNQWILNITRPKTKLVIKLTQPDARKSAGHGRHYSNAIGSHHFHASAACGAGTRPTPTHAVHRLLHLSRQRGPHGPQAAKARAQGWRRGGRRRFCLLQGAALLAAGAIPEPKETPAAFPIDGDANLPTAQVTVEYTFEKSSETPYILMPFLFEPGRESLFKLTLLSDDRDDDGILRPLSSVRARAASPHTTATLSRDPRLWLLRGQARGGLAADDAARRVVDGRPGQPARGRGLRRWAAHRIGRRVVQELPVPNHAAAQDALLPLP